MIEVEKLKKEFEKMSVRHGGSLLFEKTKFDQSFVTVFIGLGGLGSRAVNAIKTVTDEKLNNKERRFFLAVDSDIRGMNRLCLPGEGDYSPYDNVVATGIGHLKRDEKLPLYSYPYELSDLDRSVDSWIDRGKYYDAVIEDKGCSGIRQIGRITLIGRKEKYYEYYDKVSELLLTARRKAVDENLPLKVYIIAGLGGGTGSGIIVDFAYMVRRAMASFFLEHQTVEGIIFTPDVQKNDAGMQWEYYNSLCVNFYAAMKEIDYFYNNKARSKAYVCPVDGRHYAYKEDIFDECTLVSSFADGVSTARDSNEIVYKLANAIAFELGDAVGITNGNGRQNYLALYYNRANSFRHWFIRNSKGTGLDVPDFVPYKYSAIGYSSFYVPRDEIFAYSANRLAERMMDDWEKKDITDDEIRVFLWKYGLNSNRKFADRLFNMANCSELFDVEDSRLPKDGWGPLPVKNCMSYLEDMCEIAIDSSTTQSIRQLIALATNHVQDEIIKPIIIAVDKAFTSPDGRGPLYAINLLSANRGCRKGIIHHLADLLCSIDDDIMAWKAELNEINDLLCQKAEQSDGRAAIDEEELRIFSADARKYGEERLKVALLMNAREILLSIYEALCRQNSEVFSIYTVTFDYLNDMLRKDSEYVLDRDRRREGYGTVFRFDMADFGVVNRESDRIRRYFDQVIDAKDLDGQTRSFIDSVFGKIRTNLYPVDGFESRFTEKDIIDILREYFNNVFEDFTSETIEKICALAYSDIDVNPQIMARLWGEESVARARALSIAADAIESKLNRDGKILFTGSDVTRSMDHFVSFSAVYGVGSAPGIIHRFRDAENVSCMLYSNRSEYFSFKRIWDFPVSMMQSLKEYRELYEKCSHARGLHLDEVGDDWRYELPELFDYKISKFLGLYNTDGSDVTEKDRERMKKILALARKAKELGLLVTKDYDEWPWYSFYNMFYSLHQYIDVDLCAEEICEKLKEVLRQTEGETPSLIDAFEMAGYAFEKPVEIRWNFMLGEYNVMENSVDFGDEDNFGNFITLIRSNYEWERKLEKGVELFTSLNEIYSKAKAEVKGEG